MLTVNNARKYENDINNLMESNRQAAVAHDKEEVAAKRSKITTHSKWNQIASKQRRVDDKKAETAAKEYMNANMQVSLISKAEDD